jgi:glycosyltransferase involved in cell wall biosynthesis
MRVLHILASGASGAICGIRPSLAMLAESAVGERHVFRMAGADQLVEALENWNPDLLIWHRSCSWKGLPSLVLHRRCKQILFEHHYCAGFERHNVPSTTRFRAMLRLSYAFMDGVVAVSRAQRRWIQQSRLVSSQRSHVLLSSRTVDAFLSLPPPPATQAAPLTLLAYGRFTEQKGFDQLLRALRLLPDARFRLLLVGDGPQRQQLTALAAADPRVELRGAQRDIPGLLAQVDAVVIPSRWEPWGNVCLEARAAGRPVLVSDVDGLPEQVEPQRVGEHSAGKGPCGLVAGGNSDQQLASGLDALLSSSERQRRSWGEAGRISARTAWSDYVSAWGQLLDGLS